MLRFLLHEHEIPSILLTRARKKRQVVYGAEAMNIQLPFIFRRRTRDYDIYTRNPRATAQSMQALLDRLIAGGQDDFYAKRARHKGTHRVMHEGLDAIQRTKDDLVIVDYTLMPKKIGTVTINGVKYQSLPSIVKEKRRVLKSKRARFRHRKERGDLERIRVSQFFQPLGWGYSPKRKRSRKRKRRKKR